MMLKILGVGIIVGHKIYQATGEAGTDIITIQFGHTATPGRC